MTEIENINQKPDYVARFEERIAMANRYARAIANSVGSQPPVEDLSIDEVISIANALVTYLRTEPTTIPVIRLKRAYAFARHPALSWEVKAMLLVGLAQVLDQSEETVADELRESEEYRSVVGEAREAIDWPL